MTTEQGAGIDTGPATRIGAQWLLGVDTGGTFTDFVLFDGDGLRVHKVLSTPDAPERAILQGIAELGLTQEPMGLVHGSTVATNAVLEGKGVPTVFITNRGLRDLLAIGRQARRELYNLQPPWVPPPLPREQCLETGGRLDGAGRVLEPLTEADLARVVAEVRALVEGSGVRAVAINLLFSFLDDRFEGALERALAQTLADDADPLFISRSSRVLPEYREYERGMTTFLNAYVGPLVEGYVGRLERGLEQARVSVMQSSGGTVEAAQAGVQAVHMLLSGPAGGLVGARQVGQSVGRGQLLSFDMGGTSTDVALLDGEPRLTSEGHIGPWPVAVPMVDMHTIGAGGGSIAYVDAGGLLRVGPESAGADPGPACYGRGGERPTVTDANLVLGRLRPDAFLGGSMALEPEAARAAVGRVAGPLGLGIEVAAAGIVRIANTHMAHALRVISIQRGVDPRGYTLVCFGGAGGMHVCALAEALGMGRAMVPIHAGVLSALGMITARRERQLSRTLTGLLAELPRVRLDSTFDELLKRGSAELEKEGVSPDRISRTPSLDLRYHGQSYTLNIPWVGRAQSTEGFHQAHEQRYGHRLDLPVELVNVRLGLRGPPPEVHLAPLSPRPTAPPRSMARLYGFEAEVPVYARGELAPGQCIAGPALITETVSTSYIAPGWECLVEAHGNLLLDALR